MTDQWKEQAFANALRSLGEGEPKNLVLRAAPDAADRGESLAASDLTDILRCAGRRARSSPPSE